MAPPRWRIRITGYVPGACPGTHLDEASCTALRAHSTVSIQATAGGHHPLTELRSDWESTRGFGPYCWVTFESRFSILLFINARCMPDRGTRTLTIRSRRPAIAIRRRRLLPWILEINASRRVALADLQLFEFVHRIHPRSTSHATPRPRPAESPARPPGVACPPVHGGSDMEPHHGAQPGDKPGSSSPCGCRRRRSRTAEKKSSTCLGGRGEGADDWALLEKCDVARTVARNVARLTVQTIEGA